MRENTFQNVRPGFVGPRGSSEINRCFDAVERMSNLRSSCGTRTWLGSAGSFIVPDPNFEFLVKITGSYERTDGIWAHSWTAQNITYDASKIEFDSDYPEGIGNEDTSSSIPAFEYNNVRTPNGTYVWAKRGWGEWLEFFYAASSSVVPVAGGDYTISANQNNYGPGVESWFRVTSSGSSYKITGLDATDAVDGKVIVLTNAGTSTNILVTSQDSSSTATNRIITSTGNTVVVTPGMSITLQYDSTAQRWRQVSKSCEGGGSQYISTTTTTISSNQNDYSISELPGPNLIVTVTGADRKITGIDPGLGLTNGRVLQITNSESSSFNLILSHEDAGSTAQNRIHTLTETNQVIIPGDTVTLIYDTTLQRWRTQTITQSDVIIASDVTVSWSGATQNYDTGLIGDQVIRVGLTGNQNLGGIDSTDIVPWTTVWLLNTDSTDTLTLVHEDTGSNASNRFDLVNDQNVNIPPGGGALLIYDGTSSRWRLIGQSGTSSGTITINQLPTSGGSASFAGSSVPAWVGPLNLDYTDFSTAAASNTVDLGYSLPAKGVVHAVKLKHSTAFTGGGITSYSVTAVGNTSTSSKYFAASYNIFEAPSDTRGKVSQCLSGGPASPIDIDDHANPTTIRISVACDGGHTLNQATAGVLDVWLLISITP